MWYNILCDYKVAYTIQKGVVEMICRLFDFDIKEKKGYQIRFYINITNPEGWEKAIWQVPSLTDEEKEYWAKSRGRSHISLLFYYQIQDYAFPYFYFASYKEKKRAIKSFFKPSVWKFANKYYEYGWSSPQYLKSVLIEAYKKGLPFATLERLARIPDIRRQLRKDAEYLVNNLLTSREREAMNVAGNDIYIDTLLYKLKATPRYLYMPRKRVRDMKPKTLKTPRSVL